MDKDISVVVPVYNEQFNLPVLYARLKSVLEAISPAHEIIFVNDGSADGSLAVIKSLADEDGCVRYLSFTRNFGHQVAVTAGLERAGGKAVVIIDSDLQDPPELIADLYAQWLEGYKIVYAKRRIRQGETWLKRATAKLFYRVLLSLTDVAIPLDTGDFRLIDHEVVRVINQMPERNLFLRGMIAWTGYRAIGVAYDREERLNGKTGYSYRKMFRFALDGITAFSNAPLKLASITGFIVSGIAFVVILYALYSNFVLEQTITGWTSLIVSSMFIGGIQLIAIGIIGEYLARINVDVKKRPLYIVEENNVDA